MVMPIVMARKAVFMIGFLHAPEDKYHHAVHPLAAGAGST